MTDYNIPMDGWLCIWRFGYECNVKMIENGDEAVEYFTKDNGFDDSAAILGLEEGEIWDKDANGLIIVKMNRRIDSDGYIQLKVMLSDMSEEIDIYGPEEISQFTYEYGYYSALAEIGKDISDSDYDMNRLEEVTKLFNDYLANKFRR